MANTDAVRAARLRQAACAALALFVLVLSQSARTGAAQRSAWTTPLKISDSRVSAWFPVITADATGLVHLVYASGTLGDDPERTYDQIEYVAIRDGRPIGAPIDVMATVNGKFGSFAGRPSVLVNRSGMLLMTWRNREGIWFTQALATRAADPLAWRPSKFITEGYFSQILQDKGGRLHIFATTNVVTADCFNCFHLYHYMSVDDGYNWSAQRDISVLPTGAAKPQAILDADDNLHVVWEMANGGDLGQTTRPKKVAYTASYDHGETWTDPVMFVPAGPDSESANPAIAIDGKGSLILTWMAVTDDFFYSQESQDKGRTWSVPRRIAGAWNTINVFDARLDTQVMAPDSAGNLHLIVVGRLTAEQRDMSLLRFVWDGSNWSAPEVVTTVDSTISGDVPQWPSVWISGGNRLHVAWYLRKAEMRVSSSQEPGPFELYYSTAGIDAPAVAPLVYPTVTPVPLPTVTPSRVGAKPTVVQVNAVASDVTMDSLKNEYDVWRIIGLALLPMLAISLIALLRQRLRL